MAAVFSLVRQRFFHSGNRSDFAAAAQLWNRWKRSFPLDSGARLDQWAVVVATAAPGRQRQRPVSPRLNMVLRWMKRFDGSQEHVAY